MVLASGLGTVRLSTWGEAVPLEGCHLCGVAHRLFWHLNPNLQDLHFLIELIACKERAGPSLTLTNQVPTFFKYFSIKKRNPGRKFEDIGKRRTASFFLPLPICAPS